ncbi:hypothetical protein G9A89_010107 [Geosiphon pyriformis]|nr:hypothetical protein G9A89_010107 [Geosiphon pyriformis]
MRPSTFIALFLTIAVTLILAVPVPQSTPPGGKNPPTPGGLIKVTAPGKGPWAKGSQQAVSWDANVDVPKKYEQTVKIAIFEKNVTTNGLDKLIIQLGDKPYGNTWQGFTITTNFTKGSSYYALVTLASNSSIWGTSGLFTTLT